MRIQPVNNTKTKQQNFGTRFVIAPQEHANFMHSLDVKIAEVYNVNKNKNGSWAFSAIKISAQRIVKNMYEAIEAHNKNPKNHKTNKGNAFLKVEPFENNEHRVGISFKIDDAKRDISKDIVAKSFDQHKEGQKELAEMFVNDFHFNLENELNTEKAINQIAEKISK